MPDMVAAVGCAQLSKVDDLIESRRSVAARYHDGIADISGFEPHKSLDKDSHVFQLFTIVFEDESYRQQTIETLTSENISCKIYWDPPIHQRKVFKTDGQPPLPHTESVSSRVLSLPMYPTLSHKDVDRVVGSLRDAAMQF
jgi:dTDP-4-amino-4,6-dideoxygalactose transaminase